MFFGHQTTRATKKTEGSAGRGSGGSGGGGGGGSGGGGGHGHSEGERMVFRVPEGAGLRKTNKVSLVVTSGRSPFCLVTGMTIRGQLGGFSSRANDDHSELIH